MDAFNIMDAILSNDLEMSSSTSSSAQSENIMNSHETEETISGQHLEPQATGNSIDVTTSQLQEISISGNTSNRSVQDLHFVSN